MNLKKPFILVILLLHSMVLLAQDERYFRDLFSGELTRDKFQEKKKYKWEVETPFYDIDLDGDSWPESFVFAKKDGEDWINIYDKHKTLFFSKRLASKGADSGVYKISFHKLGPKYSVLLIYFNEGYTYYLNYLSTARLYFLSIDNQNLKTMRLERGPQVWREQEKRYKKYGLRKYEVGVKDLDGDGERDILVKFNNISRAYLYRGKGKWIHP
jgi:hypothetical protein